MKRKYILKRKDFIFEKMKDGKEVKLFRIEARKIIKNQFHTVKKGELGGYISEGALSQSGKAWVDKNSKVYGQLSMISGNAYVDHSELRNVQMSGRSAVLNSNIDSGAVSKIEQKARVLNSDFEGTLRMSGNARMENCEIDDCSFVKLGDDAAIENQRFSADFFGIDKKGERLINFVRKEKNEEKTM